MLPFLQDFYMNLTTFSIRVVALKYEGLPCYCSTYQHKRAMVRLLSPEQTAKRFIKEGVFISLRLRVRARTYSTIWGQSSQWQRSFP